LICGSRRKRYCACAEWFSGAKFKNKKQILGAALILGAGGDDKHKYFCICPYGERMPDNIHDVIDDARAIPANDK
jgi:hypothetical protein